MVIIFSIAYALQLLFLFLSFSIEPDEFESKKTFLYHLIPFYWVIMLFKLGIKQFNEL